MDRGVVQPVPILRRRCLPHRWSAKRKHAVRLPPADRTKLDAAEKELGEGDDRRKRQEADLRRGENLDTRRVAAQTAYVEARKAATSKVVDARTVCRKAGGAD